MLQPFFERVHRLALRGMNVGGPTGQIEKSGELYFLDKLARYYPSNTSVTLIDAGANIGQYSRAFYERFENHKTCRILALEPDRPIYAQYTGSAKSQMPRAQITALELGLGEKREDLPMYGSTDVNDHGLASLYQRRLDHFDKQLVSTGSVPIDTLDQLCRDQKIDQIQLLKLDIEGHELAALRGAKETIDAQKIDFIQFEFGGCNIDSRTYFQDFYYLLSPQYAICRLLANGLRPLKRYREEDELFITTNYIAVRKPLYENFLRA